MMCVRELYGKSELYTEDSVHGYRHHTTVYTTGNYTKYMGDDQNNALKHAHASHDLII